MSLPWGNHLGSVGTHAAGLLVLGPFRQGPHVGRSRFAKGFLIVPDIEAAGDQLVAAGVEVGEFFHDGPEGRSPGLRPQRLSYRSRALLSDPDGNGWQLQEVTNRLPRLPRRVEPGTTSIGGNIQQVYVYHRISTAQVRNSRTIVAGHA